MAREDDLPGVSPDDQEFFKELRDSTTLDLTYDANTDPDSDAWLGVDDGTRLLAVLQYHLQTEEPWGGNLRLHATAHMIAENQLAEGFEPAVHAMSRLCDGGLERHTALHALASVAIQAYRQELQGAEVGADELRERIEAAVQKALA